MESFHEGRVQQVLQLEVKERKDDMRNILQRIYNDQRSNDVSRFLEEGGALNGDDDEVSPRVFSEEELKHLWDSIESCQTEEEWDALLTSSPEIQAALAHMQRDQLDHDARLEEWFLEPWHPWWMPQLAADDEAEGFSDSPLLDESILKTPPFSTLCRRTPHPSLPYNLVEILYGVALTLRLFHGVKNSADVPEEAAAYLLESSMVLQQNDTYESMDASLTNKREILVLQDLSVLLSNYRYVARALLEGKEILQRAKKRKRLARKVEYYLSWSLAHTSMVQQLSEELETWLSQRSTVDRTSL